jgi:membrane associated rhomboid family serine protease
MSLKYQTDDFQTGNPPGDTETVQRVKPGFPVYSALIIICLIVVAIFQVRVDGTDSILFGGVLSSRIAGFLKPAFLQGEYWRILTGATVHGGLIHLAFNCYALYVLGRLIETLSNRAHLAIVFLLSAIGGNLLSLIFMPGDVPSVGASGGIIGFLGYLAVYGYRRREILTSAFLKNMLFNIGFIALYGILLNRSDEIKIDNFAHLGGLLTGAIYGFFQISGDVYKDPREVNRVAEISGLVALGTIIAVCGFSILLLLRVF